jgi:hypothetical protein
MIPTAKKLMRKPPVGPYSTAVGIAKADGRSHAARYRKQIVAELTASIGVNPDPLQRQLIERAATLAVKLDLADRASGNRILGENETRWYLSWSNSYSRILRQLDASRTDNASKSGSGAASSIGEEVEIAVNPRAFALARRLLGKGCTYYPDERCFIINHNWKAPPGWKTIERIQSESWEEKSDAD